jgi:hypothetical protein
MKYVSFSIKSGVMTAQSFHPWRGLMLRRANSTLLTSQSPAMTGIGALVS